MVIFFIQSAVIVGAVMLMSSYVHLQMETVEAHGVVVQN